MLKRCGGSLRWLQDYSANNFSSHKTMLCYCWDHFAIDKWHWYLLPVLGYWIGVSYNSAINNNVYLDMCHKPCCRVYRDHWDHQIKKVAASLSRVVSLSLHNTIMMIMDLSVCQKWEAASRSLAKMIHQNWILYNFLRTGPICFIFFLIHYY